VITWRPLLSSVTIKLCSKEGFQAQRFLPEPAASAAAPDHRLGGLEIVGAEPWLGIRASTWRRCGHSFGEFSDRQEVVTTWRAQCAGGRRSRPHRCHRQASRTAPAGAIGERCVQRSDQNKRSEPQESTARLRMVLIQEANAGRFGQSALAEARQAKLTP